jgi:hypothetical protein
MAPMNAPPKFSIIDQIRTRDGDECWLCGGKLDFRAAPNSTKAPTKEHLVAQSLGGGNELANLVLCHPGCNKHLGDRPIEKKREMREKIRANRARVAVKKVASTHSRPVAVSAPSPKLQAHAAPSQPAISAAELRLWQLFGLGSAGLFLLALGFLTGLLVGR